MRRGRRVKIRRRGRPGRKRSHRKIRRSSGRVAPGRAGFRLS